MLDASLKMHIMDSEYQTVQLISMLTEILTNSSSFDEAVEEAQECIDDYDMTVFTSNDFNYICDWVDRHYEGEVYVSRFN